jgi:UDP-glucuronate decarboxylase
MKTAIVTGGAGFIGCHLCERLLKEDYKVICMDNLITGSLSNVRELLSNPRFSFVQFDINNPITSIDESVDEIYHLASIASPEKYKKYPIETLLTSLIGTIHVLELCKTKKAKLLYTSTSEVYGDPLQHPQSEEYYGNVNTVGERSCYDEGKRVGETLLYEYRKNYDLDLKIVRLFNTYGPKMNIEDGRVVTNFIRSYKNKENITIYGSGNQTRSFCYIEDTLNGILKMMNSQEHGPINIGNPYNELSINNLVTIFEKLTHTQLCVTYLPETENDPKIRNPDITKAIALLDWKPEIPLEEGIARTLDYFMGAQSK